VGRAIELEAQKPELYYIYIIPVYIHTYYTRGPGRRAGGGAGAGPRGRRAPPGRRRTRRTAADGRKGAGDQVGGEVQQGGGGASGVGVVAARRTARGAEIPRRGCRGVRAHPSHYHVRVR
jgi:hypothetical protein